MLYGFVKFVRRRPFLTPLVVQAKVDKNAVEPGVETRAAVKFFEIAKSLQKRLLRQIFGFLAVAREIERDVIGLVLMTLHELLERATARKPKICLKRRF